MGKRREQETQSQQQDQIDHSWLQALEEYVNHGTEMQAQLRIEQQTVAILTLQAWWLEQGEIEIPFKVTPAPKDTKSFELPAHGKMEVERAFAFMIMQVCAAWQRSIAEKKSGNILDFIDSDETRSKLPDEVREFILARWTILEGLVSSFGDKFPKLKFTTELSKIKAFEKRREGIIKVLSQIEQLINQLGYSIEALDPDMGLTQYPKNRLMPLTYSGSVSKGEIVHLALFPTEHLVQGLDRLAMHAAIAPDSASEIACVKLLLLQLLQGDGVVSFDLAKRGNSYFYINPEQLNSAAISEDAVLELIDFFSAEKLHHLLEPYHHLYLQNRQVKIDAEKKQRQQKTQQLQPKSKGFVKIY